MCRHVDLAEARHPCGRGLQRLDGDVDQVHVGARLPRHRGDRAARASRHCRSPARRATHPALRLERRSRDVARVPLQEHGLRARDPIPGQPADGVEQARSERVVEISRLQLLRLALQIANDVGGERVEDGGIGAQENLRRDGAELRIHVRIVGAEPVAEAAADQLLCGRRGRALQHDVAAIEELGGVFRVRRPSARSRGTARTRWRSTPSRCRRDRERPTRSRPPDARRPAPAPTTGSRNCRAPAAAARRPTGTRAPSPSGAAIRGAMILGLGRQPAALPARERRRLRLADVDGPGERQRNLFEHAAPDPGIGAAALRRATRTPDGRPARPRATPTTRRPTAPAADSRGRR